MNEIVQLAIAGAPWVVIILVIGALVCSLAGQSVDWEHGPLTHKQCEQRDQMERDRETWVESLGWDKDKYPRV